MEVSVVAGSKKGFPESAILSIRAGSVKRQAPTSSEKSFRFGKGEAKDNLLKFDILQSIGTGYAVLKPFEDRYMVKLNDDMSCEFDIKHLTDESSPAAAAAAEKPADAAKSSSTFSVQNAQSYLDDHGVLQFIQGMIQALVKERPDDPYKYMGRHILNGYDADVKPARGGGAPVLPSQIKPKSALRGIHEQAQATLEKLLVPLPADGAPPDMILRAAPQDEAQSMKCAAPAAEEIDAEPQPAPENIDDLRQKAKELLVQGFHSGSLEASLTNSDQKGSVDAGSSVDDLRQKAKGLFVQGFYNGSLESTLAKMHTQEGGEKTVEAAQDEQVGQAPGEEVKVDAAGGAKEDETKEETKEEAKEEKPIEQAPLEKVTEGAGEETAAEEKPAEDDKETVEAPA